MATISENGRNRFALFFGVALSCALMIGCERSKPFDSLSSGHGNVAFSPDTMDFGEVKQGCRAENAVTITNNSDSEFAVDRVESSCDCLTLLVPTKPLKPGEQATVKFVLDMSREPEFVGGLRLTVTITDNANRPHQLSADVSVVAP
jgi:hypothetical protein